MSIKDSALYLVALNYYRASRFESIVVGGLCISVHVTRPILRDLTRMWSSHILSGSTRPTGHIARHRATQRMWRRPGESIWLDLRSKINSWEHRVRRLVLLCFRGDQGPPTNRTGIIQVRRVARFGSRAVLAALLSPYQHGFYQRCVNVGMVPPLALLSFIVASITPPAHSMLPYQFWQSNRNRYPDARMDNLSALLRYSLEASQAGGWWVRKPKTLSGDLNVIWAIDSRAPPFLILVHPPSQG